MKKIFDYINEINQKMKIHQTSAFAGQMAYFFVLSFFPLLIFLISIVSKLNINYEYIVEGLQEFLPSNISVLITDFISQTITLKGTVVLSVSGLTTLYSASRAVNALQRVVNTSYEVTETRNILFVKLIGMFYTLMFTVIIVLSLIIPTLAKNITLSVAEFMSMEVDTEFVVWLEMLRNILLFSCVIIVIVTIYAFLPNKKMHLKEIIPGTLFALSGSFATNMIFSKIVVQLTDYSILYGSLSAMIAFMVWVYFLALIIIIGAEINALYFTRHKPEK